MKKALIFGILALFSFALFASSVEAVTRVKGYTTKRGTYVAPHYKSTSNKTRFDNYSTKGNYNPYTGKKGYTSPYKSYKYR